MTSIDIHENYNGKLFCDCFSHITVFDPEIELEDEIKLFHRGVEMGIVKVVAVKTFPFRKLRDVDSFLDCGKPIGKLGLILRNRYNKGDWDENQELYTLVLQYTERNMEAQGALITEWWQTKNVNSLS